MMKRKKLAIQYLRRGLPVTARAVAVVALVVLAWRGFGWMGAASGAALGPVVTQWVVGLLMFGLWTLGATVGVMLGRSVAGAPAVPPMFDPVWMFNWIKDGKGEPPISRDGDGDSMHFQL
jgi:hypothetical protein